jgi:hypothetical protein
MIRKIKECNILEDQSYTYIKLTRWKFKKAKKIKSILVCKILGPFN